MELDGGGRTYVWSKTNERTKPDSDRLSFQDRSSLVRKCTSSIRTHTDTDIHRHDQPDDYLLYVQTGGGKRTDERRSKLRGKNFRVCAMHRSSDCVCAYTRTACVRSSLACWLAGGIFEGFLCSFLIATTARGVECLLPIY